MGVDVNLYVEASPTDDELDSARAHFRSRSGIADDYEDKWQCLERSDDPWFTTPRVVANVTCRYWGPGYERGSWPDIYGAIRLMQHLFPGRPVYYGGDSFDDGMECTDELLAEYWEHFLGDDGNNYREAMSRHFGRTGP